MKNPLIPVGIFTGLYLLIASFFAIGNANWEFIFYIAVVVVLAVLVMWLHSRIKLHAGTLWCLTVWGLLHMIGGLMPVPAGWPYNGDKAVFYSWWIIPDYLKYDHIVHAFGFGICTWITWQALRMIAPGVKPTFGVLVLCMMVGMGLGGMNEIIEFMAVLGIPDTNVGGYINTGWDLVSNFVGCLIAALCIRATNDR